MKKFFFLSSIESFSFDISVEEWLESSWIYLVCFSFYFDLRIDFFININYNIEKKILINFKLLEKYECSGKFLSCLIFITFSVDYRIKEGRVQKILGEGRSYWLVDKSAGWSLWRAWETWKCNRVSKQDRDNRKIRFIKKCLGAPSDTDVE